MAEAQIDREIRIAVVMYGGSSLAIYMNGVAQELLQLARATSPNACGKQALTGTARVYRKLAHVLAGTQLDALTDAVVAEAPRVRFDCFGTAFETNQRFRPLSSMPTGVDAPMIDLLEQHVHEVASACAKHRVARLDVFGSATRPDFRPGDSDLDLLVDFQPMAPIELVDAYYGLLDDLRAIFDAPIDLVMRDAVKNRYLAAAIDRERRLVYAA